MKLNLISTRSAALLALTAVAGAAAAQDVIATVQNPWAGWYAGGNIGGAWNNTCNTWEPGAAITSGNYPGLASKFYNRDCPNNGNFIGGVQFGYFFQSDQWVWGFGADYEAIGSKTNTRSYTLASGSATYPIPDGTYTASGKTSPNGIFLSAPRSAIRSISGCRIYALAERSRAVSIRRRSLTRRLPLLRQLVLPRLLLTAARTSSRADSMWASASTTTYRVLGRLRQNTTTSTSAREPTRRTSAPA